MIRYEKAIRRPTRSYPVVALAGKLDYFSLMGTGPCSSAVAQGRV